MLDCVHSVKSIKERVRKSIVESSGHAFIVMKFNDEQLETILDGIVMSVAYQVVAIMGEHGDEVIAEMKRIMDQGVGK